MKMDDDVSMDRNSFLLRLSKLTCVDDGVLKETYREVTETLSHSLKVGRASIWFYSEGEQSIICQDLFEGQGQIHSSGIELF